MKKFLLFGALLTGFASGVHALPGATDSYAAKGGAIKVTPIYHASVQIEFGGKVVQVDPFSAGDLTGSKKADLVLITHTHPDHYDLKAIAKISKPKTEFILPLAYDDLSETARDLGSSNTHVLGNGETITVDGIKVDTVPAYNLVRGPKPGQKFHPKGQFNGYVLTLGGKRIYIAGDTEATPEMKKLKNIDLAFLPMNLPYTMTPPEAATGAKAFKPKAVYPYHYRYPFTKANTNPQQFAAALKGSGIKAVLRDWYAHPAK